MATIVTRAGKGSPLTNNEVDANFTNLNSDKVETSAISAFGGTLIDDADAATARTTLGLGTAATTASTDYATAAQGALADSALQSADNLSDLANAATARTNLGLGSAATSAATDFVTQTSTTGSAEIPAGTEAQRDGAPSAGYFRFNTDSSSFEGYDGTAWGAIGGSVDFSAVGQDILPDADSTRDIGSTSARWAQGWFDDVTLTNLNGNPIATAGSLSSRNRIINGNFGINQRGVSGTVTLSAGAYGHDRWKAGASGCTYTFATSANVTTITISAGSLVQVIEGLNLQSGTHVLSWTGTVQMKIDGGAAGNSGMTGTLTGGTNATVETSGTGTLSLVQLEAGDTATPFEHRSYGQELALCQRYYTKIGGENAADIYGGAYITGGGFILNTLTLPVKMRVAPTGAVVGTWAVSNVAQPTIAYVSTTTFVLYASGTAVGQGVYYNPALTDYLTFDAEI